MVVSGSRGGSSRVFQVSPNNGMHVRLTEEKCDKSYGDLKFIIRNRQRWRLVMVNCQWLRYYKSFEDRVLQDNLIKQIRDWLAETYLQLLRVRTSNSSSSNANQVIKILMKRIQKGFCGYYLTLHDNPSYHTMEMITVLNSERGAG